MLDLKFRPEVSETDKSHALAFAEKIDQRSFEDSTITGYTSYGARKVGESNGSPSIEVIGVSEGVKRDGSVVRVSGIDLSNIKANPVFMWAHEYHLPPIGRIEKFTRGTVKGLGKVVRITVSPLQSQMDSEHKRFADAIFDMFLQGDLRTVSMGWRTLDAEIMRDDDGFFQGFDFKKTDALEFSAAPIPADPDALVTKIKQRGLDPEKVMDHFVTERSKSIYMLRDTPIEDFDIQSVEMADEAVEPVEEKRTEETPEVTPEVSADIVRTLTETNKELLATIEELRQLIESTDDRIGAALNSKNKGLLANAVTSIQTVLKNAGGEKAAFPPEKEEEDKPADDEKDPKKKKKKKKGEKDEEMEDDTKDEEKDEKPKRVASYDDIVKFRDDVKSRFAHRRQERIQKDVLGGLAAKLRASKTHSSDQ